MKWTRKPKILVVSDSSAIHTGFATVARQICTHLYMTGKYEVKSIGWFHNPSIKHTVPYEIIPTKQASNQADTYASVTFPEVVKSYMPDLVLGIGDPWMLEALVSREVRNKYILVLYIPVDGIPLSESFGHIFTSPDLLVAYGKFGKDVILDLYPQIEEKTIEIPHGVELEIFTPVSDKRKIEMKEMFGANDLFVIGTVARNQPRKMIPRMLKMAKMFMSEYCVCHNCREMSLEFNDPECQVCHSAMAKRPGKDNIRIYLHMALNDCGWNIPALVKTLGLKGKVAFPEGLQIGKGVDISTLAKIIASMDVFTLPTGGEGFGLPIILGMSCGLPCVVTNYSGHVDFCKGVTDLVNVSEFETETVSNVERALVDLNDYTMRMDRLYYDDKGVFDEKWGKYIEENNKCYTSMDWSLTGKKLRDSMGAKARRRAEEYSWKDINEKWEGVLSNALNYHSEVSNISESGAHTADQYEII